LVIVDDQIMVPFCRVIVQVLVVLSKTVPLPQAAAAGTHCVPIIVVPAPHMVCESGTQLSPLLWVPVAQVVLVQLDAATPTPTTHKTNAATIISRFITALEISW
jgi:hypothetical protein